MLIDTLKTLFARDLGRLRNEIASYTNEQNIWKIGEGISNSGGNLCLHLIGNLNTYIGKEIGKTGYVRNREAEFSLKNLRREELLSKIDQTVEVVNSALDLIPEGDLKEEYPVLVFDKKTSTEY